MRIHNLMYTLFQAVDMRPEIVPRVDMTFASVEHAYYFYSVYAE